MALHHLEQPTTEEWSFTGIPPATTAVGYADAIVGDMYYNTTDGLFKAIKTGGAPIGTWAAGNNLNTARGDGIGGAGTQTAGLAFAGAEPTVSNKTEKYDGSSWTETTELNTARAYVVGTGATQTAALCIGGASPQIVVEQWDGSTWTEVAEVYS